MRSEARFDEANQAAREHLERTKQRLASGRERLERLHRSIDDTNRHLETISDWIEETERALDEERKRRSASGG
jgi:septal ring factor EnvC (AmiA/AmiB activator)